LVTVVFAASLWEFELPSFLRSLFAHGHFDRSGDYEQSTDSAENSQWRSRRQIANSSDHKRNPNECQDALKY
jgi:hypothetical protein